MDVRLHKADFIRGVLVTKKPRKMLILYIVKNDDMLDINLGSIKLH